MAKNGPDEDPPPAAGEQGRGTFFPKKPTADASEFATDLIIRLFPGRIGKVIAIGLSLVCTAVILMEMMNSQLFQWLRRLLLP